MAYATCHLLGHGLGLVSTDVMDWTRERVLGIWHDGPLEVVLLAALAVHVALAIWLVATRPSLNFARWQWAQLVLGFLAVLSLAQHVAGTALVEAITDADIDDHAVLLAVWPDSAVAYSAMLTGLWLHGCLGLHFWWRLHPRYRTWQPWLLAVAVAVPALALGGFASAGRDVAHRAAVEADGWAAAGDWPAVAERVRIVETGDRVITALVFGGLGLALLWRGGRALATRRGTVRLTYASGHEVRARAGLTLLEMSREAGVAHAAVCGGRARCSTCRVRVTQGLESLPPPSPAEQRLLDRLGHPEGVRLACQIKPTEALTVLPLVAPPTALADARADVDPNLGRERELAVLFADLRGFTRFSESRLPYDVVYVLNQYARAMGEAIEAAGGHLDKVMGDGVMALFGLDEPVDAAARRALDAAARMAAGLERLNTALAAELDQPLRMVIGIHLGPVVVGEVGHGRARQLTAIGDTVNVASRLEAVAKEHDVQLAVSESVLHHAAVTSGVAAGVTIRGRSAAIAVHLFADAQRVPVSAAASAQLLGTA